MSPIPSSPFSMFKRFPTSIRRPSKPNGTVTLNRKSSLVAFSSTHAWVNSVDNRLLPPRGVSANPLFGASTSTTRFRRSYSASKYLWKDDEKDQNGDLSTGLPTSPFAAGRSVGGGGGGGGSSNGVGVGDDTPSSSRRRKKKTKFIPRKAAVQLSDNARTLFKKLLDNNPSKDGILLNYDQSSTGEPRMVFSFRFVTKNELVEEDEGVSLELNEDGTPKSPRDALNDGLPKLYIHHNGFLKVLGATVDVDMETMTPILYDREGFEMDANA